MLHKSQQRHRKMQNKNIENNGVFILFIYVTIRSLALKFQAFNLDS